MRGSQQNPTEAIEEMIEDHDFADPDDCDHENAVVEQDMYGKWAGRCDECDSFTQAHEPQDLDQWAFDKIPVGRR